MIVDLGSHVIDLMRYLLGDYADIFCKTKNSLSRAPRQGRKYGENRRRGRGTRACDDEKRR
ncbi:MAG: hypothetical protein L6V93_20065 [Clostridiales bacterium]|nr:MAG: hypothetical protein L6V93_20065 [Clostridiales bacterium]